MTMLDDDTRTATVDPPIDDTDAIAELEEQLKLITRDEAIAAAIAVYGLTFAEQADQLYDFLDLAVTYGRGHGLRETYDYHLTGDDFDFHPLMDLLMPDGETAEHGSGTPHDLYQRAILGGNAGSIQLTHDKGDLIMASDCVTRVLINFPTETATT